MPYRSGSSADFIVARAGAARLIAQASPRGCVEQALAGERCLVRCFSRSDRVAVRVLFEPAISRAACDTTQTCERRAALAIKPGQRRSRSGCKLVSGSLSTSMAADAACATPRSTADSAACRRRVRSPTTAAADRAENCKAKRPSRPTTSTCAPETHRRPPCQCLRVTDLDDGLPGRGQVAAVVAQHRRAGAQLRQARRVHRCRSGSDRRSASRGSSRAESALPARPRMAI